MRNYRGLTKEGKWVYGYYYIKHRHLTKLRHTISEPHPMGEEYEVIIETVGQQTGLKDKNGKEIYEGSLVTVYFGDLPSTLTAIARIVYLAQCQFVAEGIGKDKGKGPWSIDSKHIEVIGNIHQNPELLEQENG